MFKINKAFIFCFMLFIISALNSDCASAAPLLDPDNGHYYEAIPGDFNWLDAKGFAEGSTYLGVQGHLATLTSLTESDWVWNNLGNPFRYLLGASDLQVKGTWQWVTGEPWSFTNWNIGEPNNGNGFYDEDVLSFWDNSKWNDLPATNNIIIDNPNYQYVFGYIAEYDTVVPEPSTFLLFPLGLLSAYFLKNKKTRHLPQ